MRLISNIKSRLWGQLLVAGCLAGCSFDASGVGGGADGGGTGQGGGMADARPDDPRFEVARLLLSEVSSATGEFIEIYNPGDMDISLGRYYISDNAGYAYLPGAFGGGQAPDSNEPASDFIARFPDSASIQAGEAIVVAISFSAFQSEYSGQQPDYSLFGDFRAGRPMLDAGQGSGRNLLGAGAEIAGEGEGIVVFHWDGTSDLVVDVDMVNAGYMLAAANRLANKSSISVDGPDIDTSATSYRADGYTIPYFLADTEEGQSYMRIRGESGHEMQDGRHNGVQGDDETTEDITKTWEISDSPTPGVVHPCVADVQGAACADS